RGATDVGLPDRRALRVPPPRRRALGVAPAGTLRRRARERGRPRRAARLLPLHRDALLLGARARPLRASRLRRGRGLPLPDRAPLLDPRRAPDVRAAR